MSKKHTRKAPFKTWDELVKEYTVEPWTDQIGGESIEVSAPTGKQIRMIRDAGDDMDAIIPALFGEKTGEFLLDQWDDAPAMVLSAYVQQVMAHFGLADDEGNPRTGRS